MQVLNITVPNDLRAKWLEWFAPAMQPFLVDSDLANRFGKKVDDRKISPEIRDTFELYGMAASGLGLIWFDEAEFLDLERPDRARLVRAQRTLGRALVPSVRQWGSLLDSRIVQQADGHRFTWWASLVSQHEDPILTEFVTGGRRASRHEHVAEDVWSGASDCLPEAQRLAGRFPASSGPNCFGMVMAAAGVDEAEDLWMQREPFEQWLRDTARPGGQDGDPGTVLLWRDRDGTAQHVAVTLGSGWALHKPSQGWMSPTSVLTIDEVKGASRVVGHRLHRFTISG